MFGGILPYSYDVRFPGEKHGDMIFLLGQESYKKNFADSGKWSGFGGSKEDSDPDVYYTAARESYEEAMGFFGTTEEIYNIIKDSPAFIDDNSLIVLVNIDYNPDISEFYSRIYKYIHESFPKNIESNDGYLEKQQIRWFTINEILYTYKDMMRPVFLKFFENNLEKIKIK